MGLPGVDLVAVSSAEGSTFTGNAWLVTFLAPAGDMPTIVVNTTGFTAINVTAVVTTLEDGSSDLLMDPIPADYLQVLCAVAQGRLPVLRTREAHIALPVVLFAVLGWRIAITGH